MAVDIDLRGKEDVFQALNRYLWNIQNDPTIDVPRTTEALITRLSELLPHEQDKNEFFWDPNDLSNLGLNYIRERMENRGLPGFASGLPKLDEMIGGFEVDNIYTFNAQPGSGKTTLLVQLAWSVASQTPTIFFSPEARAQMMSLKLISALSGGAVPIKAMRRGDLTNDQWEVARLAADRLKTRPIYIYDMPSINAKEMKRIIDETEEKIGKKCGAIFLDYLQQMEGEDSFLDLTNNMKQVEALVIRQHAACILASQVGRAAGNSGTISLTAGKGTGKIEELASVVIGVERPEFDETSSLTYEEQRVRRVLICSKNRWEGELFSLGIRYSKATGWYEEEGLIS